MVRRGGRASHVPAEKARQQVRAVPCARPPRPPCRGDERRSCSRRCRCAAPRAAACLAWPDPLAGACANARSASSEDGMVADWTVIRCTVSLEDCKPLLRGAANRALPVVQAPESFCYSNATSTVMLSVDSATVTILLYCSPPKESSCCLSGSQCAWATPASSPAGLGHPHSQLAADNGEPQLPDVMHDAPPPDSPCARCPALHAA
jgi:hypothetical protein